MKIAHVVLHLGRQAMEVVAEQSPVRRRLVTINWMAKDGTDVPPDDWAKQVEAELSFQDSDPMSGIIR
jgi:hypothetical protein